MKRFVLCLAALLLVPGVSMAQPFDGAATVNLVVGPASYGGCADPIFDYDERDCASLAADQAAVAGNAFAWVVVSRNGGFPDIGGAQFGVQHSGVLGWTLCTGGSEIPDITNNWPDSGAGNAVTWGGGCYSPAGSNAKVGFYAIQDGAAFSGNVIQDPRTGTALWADCGAPPDVPPVESEICPENLGSVDTAGTSNLVCDDNCGSVPTVETTWGTIKSLF